MKVRFFDGWGYPADTCGKDYVDIGYQGGVPMGGDLPARTGRDGAPMFITAASRERLCAVWKDPQFDPKQHAFYYVRVLEEPVCRYSTLWCRKWIGVDPLDTASCNSQLTALKNGNPAQQAKAS